MSENEPVKKSPYSTSTISFGTITFLIGCIVAGITVFTFMESRIAKEVHETIYLAQLQEKVKGLESAMEERNKVLKDQIWQNDQNARQAFLEVQNRLSTLESRAAASAAPLGGSNPPAPPAPSF